MLKERGQGWQKQSCCFSWAARLSGYARIVVAARKSVTPRYATPPVSPTPPLQTAPATSIIGYSVQHRPIAIEKFGAGEHPVLIMGAIHGDESAAATIARDDRPNCNIIHAAIGGVRTVAIIEIANPDGYAAKTRVQTRITSISIATSPQLELVLQSARQNARRNNFGSRFAMLPANRKLLR